MDDKGVLEQIYLKTNIKELIDECTDIELLYLISGILREDAS